MVIDDLPIRFPNSRLTATETIRLPVDVEAQWDMIRWAKSRGGVLIADRVGPIWMSGGAVTLTGNPREVLVSAVEGWALEEINQEERVALYVQAGQTSLMLSEPSIVMLVGDRGMGRITSFPLILPSTPRNAGYIEVPDTARVGVPLAVVMADAVAPMDWGMLHDMRVAPFGCVYVDRNTVVNYKPVYAADVSEGWAILRNHRIWHYAPAGQIFEVIAFAGAIRPYYHADLPIGTDIYEEDVTLPNENDYTLERKMALCIDGVLTANELDSAGIEVLHGLTLARYQPLEDTPKISDRQPLLLRSKFVGVVDAIHDIALAVRIGPGENREYKVQVTNPQMMVRTVQTFPQFELDAGGL